METTPIFGWRTPSAGEVADGPADMKRLAIDIENTFASTLTNTYTPAWTGTSENPANPAARIGRYRVQNGFCELLIWLTFGTSTFGGRGNLSLSLPVPALSTLPEQWLQAKLWIPNTGTFHGMGYINQSTPTVVGPYFPNNWDTTVTNHWRSSDASGADPTSAIPRATSGWGVQSGGNILVTGRYAVA